jgi:hypothetical protein
MEGVDAPVSRDVYFLSLFQIQCVRVPLSLCEDRPF